MGMFGGSKNLIRLLMGILSQLLAGCTLIFEKRSRIELPIPLPGGYLLIYGQLFVDLSKAGVSFAKNCSEKAI